MVLGYRLAAQGETPKVAGLCPSLKPLSSLNGRHEASFYVNTLAIYPEARGSGLGTLLLESAERKARKAHCAGMLLEVFADNERAMRLYERHGFSPMPSVPSIASEDEPEVVVLEKIISRSPAEVCCAGTTCQHRANGPGICSRAELFDG